MARRGRFELPTFWAVVSHSIQPENENKTRTAN